MEQTPQWLDYAIKLQSIAQAGLEYSKDKYDIERFQQIRDISVDIVSNYTDIKHEKIKNLFANETGYQTPKVDIRAAIFRDNKILLVKEKIDGLWSLPGGWAEVNLSVRENALKESREEAGAIIQTKRIIAIQDRKKHNTPINPYGIYKIFVQCDYIKGTYEDNIETSKADFFTLDQLPPLSLGRNTKEQIEMCFKALNRDDWQVIFD